ncbi:hypothetical protein B0T17DRAFT_492939 [Bombardia bombarda]|uniref:Glycosyltransferase family 31 protein n=1 Tax=Bombardia bombarda TaxID=252184 RepID=A0AA39X289_9PEZI|nr:hypothetical protein B0T17DRAFT_492939 [Bombardia bombarda]
MLLKAIHKRGLSRSLSIIVTTVLAIFFLLTVSRLRHGSLLPSFDGVGRPSSEQHEDPIRTLDRPELPPGQCSSEIDFLRRPQLALADKIVYSRRCIKTTNGSPSGKPVDRDAVANMSQPLVTSKTVVNLTSCSHPDLIPCETLSLPVPPAYPKMQYPHLLFGVASKYDRMNDSLPAFAHWLSSTGARLIGIIVDVDERGSNFNLTSLEAAYRREGILATFLPPKPAKRLNHQGSADSSNNNNNNNNNNNKPAPVEHHHFMLIRELVTVATPSTRWLGILDDDTFFPSLYPLDHELASHDHTKPHWLGALSDDFDSVKLFGFMAYGGAGVFLSTPLARQLEPLSERCIAEATINTGDGILRDCVYAHTRTKLTIVPGLHQHDLQRDASGFFESGVRPLSVHHWKSWYKEPLPSMAAVTRLCGDCFLQRFRFGGGGDVLLANGYSITQYPPGVLDSLDLGRIEGTWSHPEHEYDFSYGPLRKKLPPDQKKSYRLADSYYTTTKTASNTFHQIYLHRASDDDDTSEVKINLGIDEVIELVWEV